MVRRWPMRQPFFGCWPMSRSLRGMCRQSCISMPTGPASSCAHREGRATGASIRGDSPRIPARILGRTLAALHGLRADLPDASMWGLQLPEPSHELVLELSAGAQELVARIQASESVCTRLGELSRVNSDRGSCTLICAGRTASRCRRRALGAGLVCCSSTGSLQVTGIRRSTSAACSLSTCVCGSARSRSSSRSIRPGSSLTHAIRWLRCGRPCMHSGRRTDRFTSLPLSRVVELGAVRLLQTAVERAQGLSFPSAHVVTLVQLADNMLQQPDDAAVALLGLRP